MKTYRTKQRLNVETSKKSVNTDVYLKVDLNGKERLLPPDEINHIVNVGEQFNIERQDSKFYRVFGTIHPVVSNPLFNLIDTPFHNAQTWGSFNQVKFLDTSYPKDNDVFEDTDLTYPQSIKKYLKEVNGWFGYMDPSLTGSNACNFIHMEPTSERFSFLPDIAPYDLINHPTDKTPIKNWNLTITYPESTDTMHPIVSGATAGLLIVEAISVTVSERVMTAFGMPCLHNLIVGDTVTISGTNGYDGIQTVVRTGLDNGDLQGYYFVIDLPPTGTISNNSRMRRIAGGFESIYYFRKFKKIKTKNMPIIEMNDYESYRLAFCRSVYDDELSQFVFNEDIDITDLQDNLGRPISELYLTIVKTDSDKLFTQVKSGIETPFLPRLLTSSSANPYLRDVPVINRIHNGGTLPFTSHVPLEISLDVANYDTFYGDLVEYNISEVKETILADVSHRFNTKNRETVGTLVTAPAYDNSGNLTISSGNGYVSNLAAPPTLIPINLGPRQEGYFYKAHHLIKIREYSSYIEQGDSSVIGIPDYAVDLGDGRYLWRDLLDIGFNESDTVALDYPFLNGCHYMYQNNCFTLRRQDPFNSWGLYYSKFPADPIGDRMTDKYTTNTENNVC